MQESIKCDCLDTKVAAAFFQMLELVCQYHTSALVELPSPIWASLITSLWQGLKGFEAVVMNQCCYALDHLASFAFDNTGCQLVYSV